MLNEQINIHDRPGMTAIVIKKTTDLVRGAVARKPDALIACMEIRRTGIPIHISGAVDLTGSMINDIGLVSKGVGQYLSSFTDSMPQEVVDSLGKDFLRVTGATVGFRDLDCDGDDTFRMTLFSSVLPATYIDKSTKYSESDMEGGGGNLGESQLLGLLLTLGIPRTNALVGSVFEQIRAKIENGSKLMSPTANFDRFTRLYDEFAAHERKPDMVYLVTDEPPKVQLGIDSRAIASLSQVIRMPKIVFFVRHHVAEWTRVADGLGAEVYDLEKAGEANVGKPEHIAAFMHRAFGEAMLLSVNNSLPQLSAPPTP